MLILLLAAAVGVGGRRAGVLPSPIHPVHSLLTSHGRAPWHAGATRMSPAAYHTAAALPSPSWASAQAGSSARLRAAEFDLSEVHPTRKTEETRRTERIQSKSGRRWLDRFGLPFSVRREEKKRSRPGLIKTRALAEQDSAEVVKSADVQGYGLIKTKRSMIMESFGLVRALSFAVVLFGVAAVICVLMRLVLGHTRRTDPDKRAVMNRLNTLWAKIVTCLFFRVQVVNPENLPALDDTKAYVYIANHQSFMDILSMYFVNRPFKWVSKASIQKIPVIGWAMGMTGHVLLQRDDRRSQIATIRLCIDKLKKGASMFFFPEGTRSKNGQLGQFKKGAFSIARKANVGMVPITVLGTGDLMPAGRETRLFPSRLGVKLVVHPTITAQELQDLPDDELLDRAFQTIRSALPPALQ